MTARDIDPDLPALGIRQPWAELILRGVKTIEVRSQNTQVRGPIYLYASSIVARTPDALAACRKHGIEADQLPRSLLVGTVEITGVVNLNRSHASAACVAVATLSGHYGWRLANPQRLAEPVAPRVLPYGMWFYPWKRRTAQSKGERGP